MTLPILHFGHHFDGLVHAPVAGIRTGAVFAGPTRLLHWLETQLGLRGYPENTDYLRIELYRQSLQQYLDQLPSDTDRDAVFFVRSFAADRFATATTLLTWRDELLLAGWGFTAQEPLPARLHAFSQVESIFTKKINDPAIAAQVCGFADRYAQVVALLPGREIALGKVVLYEPAHLQLPVIQRVLKIIAAKNIPLATLETTGAAAADSMLGGLQRNTPFPAQAAKDAADQPGIVILRARRDSDAATYLAQMLRENPSLRPHFLAPEMSLALEQSLLHEGFPAMGILSASLARPSLQVLKLAPAFLWEPLDVFKIMEFATLPVKPLDGGLALEIARVMAQKPGINSDMWFAAVFGYLEQISVSDVAREQYEFWFGRRRYAADGTAPKRDAIGLYAYLHEWALEYFKETENDSLLVLAEQARRIRDLLEALPEQRISFLELERIVRTIYEPSPIQLLPAEAGRFDFVHQTGAFAAPVDTLIWWNCLFQNTAPAPEKWFAEERSYLENQGIALRTTHAESQLNLLLQQRPVQQTTRQLILVVPEQADGAEAVPSLLLGDIEALLPNCRDFTYHLDRAEDRTRLAQWFRLAALTTLPVRPTGRPQAVLPIAHPELMAATEYETPTNLESLFYYPHRWFFRQKLKLYPSSQLSVTRDTTLLGSLAHRFFEILLQEDLQHLDRQAVQEWVEEQAKTLLEREGATLLLYGREPERNAFLTRVKNAAWSLISLLRSNNWSVLHTELELNGEFGGIPVRGKADLVLQRGAEMAIVDLKWSGAKRRKELIQNGEDLQLVLYAKLLPPPEQWPHTAYFILEEGKMIARNTSAFKEAMVAGQGDDHAAACTAIFEKMEKTFRWRMEQLRRGQLELRTARTAIELEALYEGQLFDLLEMKNEDARWDDYRTLLEG